MRALAALGLAAIACGAARPHDPTAVGEDDAILWFTAVPIAMIEGSSPSPDPGPTPTPTPTPSPNPGPSPEPTPSHRRPILDAALWVDGIFVGTLDALRGGVAVEPGPHRFEIRHDDYISYYARLTLAPKQRQRLRVELAPVLR